MIKNYYFLLLFILGINSAIAQVVTIGTGQENDDQLPINPYFGYTYSQSIYLSSEISNSGTIYRITYKGAPNLSISNSNDWVVYMGHVTQDEFTANNWVATTAMTQVFNGTIAVVNNNVEITLSTPFVYNGTDNLIIAVDENSTGYDGGTDDFLSSNVSGIRSILYRNDNTNPDPTNITQSTINQSAIPNIDIDFNAVACSNPTTLAVSNVLSNAATAQWTAGASETAWNMQYGASGFSIGSGSSVSVSTSSHTLSNLSPATDYDFYVQADCGGTTSAWVGPYTFTTACATITNMPFSEDFESITSGQPNCWSLAGTTTSNTYHWYSNASGQLGRGMRFNSYFNGSGKTSLLSTPVLDINSLTSPQLRFNFKNAVGGNFEVLVSNDAGATFTTLESNLTGVADWALKVYDLTAYKDNDVVVQFKGTSNATASGYIYLDNVIVQEAPACEAPYNISLSNTTATTAQLSWDASSSHTDWEIEYGDTGFTQSNGTTVTVSTNPYSLMNLSASTTYDVYVRANCGSDTSTWTGPFTFSTPCAAYDIPFIEGFENAYSHNTAIGGCLEQESDFGSQQWTANNTFTNYNRSPRTGSFNAFLRYNNRDWIFIPINLLGGTSYTVDLYARQDGATAANASIEVKYGNAASQSAMTNDIVTATGIINNDYQKITGNFTPANDGIYYVGIKGDINNSPFYISLDDIKIDVSPNCLEPTSLMVSDLSDTTARLSWTAGGSETEWEIEYGIDGFTQGSGTLITNLTTSSHDINMLSATTDYQFYVRANCGADLSAWAGPFDFTTICSDFSAPYLQNFDGTTAPELDTCWTNNVISATSNFAVVETTTFNDLSAPNSLKFQNSSDNNGDYYLISPRFSDLDATKRVRFQVYKDFNGDSNSGVLELGVMTNVADYNTFVSVHTFDVTTFDENAWKQVIVNLNSYTGAAGHIVVKYQPGTADYKVLYMDDFIYEVAPTAAPLCASNLQSTENQANCGNKGFTMSWDAVQNADGYKLTIGTTTGGNDILDQQDVSNTTSYNLSTTNGATTYYWTLTPYNNIGDATACSEQSYTTDTQNCVCTPVFTGSNSNLTYIDKISVLNAVVNMTNENTGFSTQGYGDYYDTKSITVAQNTSFDISVELQGGTVGVAVWIDWNKDYIFDTTTELFYESAGWVNAVTNQTINVPTTIADGDYRMRVLIDFNDSTPGDNPCEFDQTRGEAEDYKITVNNTLSNPDDHWSTFTYYPNPVQDIVNLNAPKGLSQVQLYSIDGKLLTNEQVNGSYHQLHVHELPKGMYFIKLFNGSSYHSVKIVKD